VKFSAQLKSTLFVFSLLVGFSCRNDKENIPAPTSACDTIAVSYSASVKIILQNNCYSCHSTAVTQNGGFDVENWTSLKNYLNLSYRGDGIYGSKFFHIVNQDGLVPHMPPTGKLSDCELSKIRSWIRDGALQN
jgi:hypothetical protein